MSKIIDAVSVVFSFDDKIYYVKRQNYLKAFPGYTAFPGGKVDKADYDIPSQLSQLENIPSHLLNALVRETQEELNFDLVQAVKEGVVKSIHVLGRAVTPDFNPQRFATHFYRVDLNHEVLFRTASDEASEFGWLSAKVLYDNYMSGDLLVVPPIANLLRQLSIDPNKKFIGDLEFHYDSEIEVPLIESVKGVRQLPILSNTLLPATRTNCFVIGDDDSAKFAIDPSPKNEIEYQKMISVLRKFNLSGIMFTHHHADHNEFGPQLAFELKLPLYMSLDTKNRLTNIRGISWFKGIVPSILKEGDVLTTWHKEKVIVYEIPGHDEGHLALAPESLRWFIAGDLFQGVGTVVIGGEEGDMQKYFSTLKRVIDLSPRVLYPSHGIGLGGTYILEKTLEHRMQREEQILSMIKLGKSEDNILKEIYFDVDPRLHKYALANIQSHTKKLKIEGKI